MKAHAPIARRIGIGLLAIGATLLTGACAAGQLAATSLETPGIDGVQANVGDMGLHAVAIVAPDGPCVLPGADAALTFVLVNNGHSADSLQGVSSPRFTSSAAVATADDLSAYAKADPGTGSCTEGTGSASASAPAPAPSAAASLPAPAGPQTVQPGHLLQLGVYDAGTNAPGVPTEPIVLLRNLQGGPLFPGESVPVTFTFATGGSTTLQVPVQLSVAPNNGVVPSVTNQATEAVN